MKRGEVSSMSTNRSNVVTLTPAILTRLIPTVEQVAPGIWRVRLPRRRWRWRPWPRVRRLLHGLGMVLVLVLLLLMSFLVGWALVPIRGLTP